MSRQTQIVAILLVVLIVIGAALITRHRPFQEVPQEPSLSNAERNVDLSSGMATTTLTVGDAHLEVELPKTEGELETGLGGRLTLSEGHGMLFALEYPDFYEFWMKDMLFPIDIIWLDEEKRVVNIKANLSPHTYPQTFSPTGPSQYVLEVPAGSAAKNHIKTGDIANF